MLIDTHCHLDFSHFSDDRDDVILRAKEAGVHKMITIGCTADAAPTAVSIAESNENIFAAVGIHPDEVSEHFSDDFSIVSSLSQKKEVVAIGETGLDFFRPENPTKKMQFDAFEKHAYLAKKRKKPVIVHLRNAEKQAEEFFSTHHNFPFVIHCFSSDWSFAKKILDWGGMISFTGIITFKNVSPDLIEVAKKVPVDRIMVETDAPFLAPVPVRGKRCEPAFVRHTAQCLADIRGETYEALCMRTTRNAEIFFEI